MSLFIGTDIESVDRFNKLVIDKKTLLEKMFYKSELEYALSKVNSGQSLAGIWCAKESVLKAFSQINDIFIADIEIICEKNSAPVAIIHNSKFNTLNFSLSISISHTKDYANAVSILLIKNNQI